MGKYLNLEERHLQLIAEIKEREHIKTDTKALQYILDEYMQYQNQEYIVEKMVQKYNEEFNGALNGIKAILNDLEDKTTIVTDVLNTELILGKKEQCIPMQVMESPVITQSKKQRKYDKGKEIQRRISRRKKTQK